MGLLRAILYFFGWDDAVSSAYDDNGTSEGGGNSSIAASYTTKARLNAPAVALVHHPRELGWVGTPHAGRGRIRVRLRYDTPEARRAALQTMTVEGGMVRVTVPVIPRSAVARIENPPNEVVVRW